MGPPAQHSLGSLAGYLLIERQGIGEWPHSLARFLDRHRIGTVSTRPPAPEARLAAAATSRTRIAGPCAAYSSVPAGAANART
jgi:hypothetical protein